MKFSFLKPSRIVSVFLSLILLVSVSMTIAPQKTDAFLGFGDIVNDPLNMIQTTVSAVSNYATKIKGYSLDPIAWMIAKATLQAIVKSTINSVNKGPNGSPQFVTNLNSTLLAVGDTAANSFLSQLSSNNSIKSPFQTAVASSLKTYYGKSTGSNSFFSQNPFTLGKSSPNPTTALNGGMFTAQGGGLNAWMSAWSNPANNPFGASILAGDALSGQVTNAQSVQKTELNWGQGYLANRGKCPTTTTGATTQTAKGGTSATASASSNTVGSLITSLSANSTCQSSGIKTQGSTIKTGLDKSLGSGIDTLVSAHSFDEVVNALLGQLISQVVTTGLSALSQPVTTTSVVPATATTATTTAKTTYSSYFDQTDPSQTAVSISLGTNFSSTLSEQITSLQQFQSQWASINSAAQSAKAALSTASELCYPNAQSIITNTVQPVIDQAAQKQAQATAGITAIQKIQAELPSSTATTDQTAVLSKASSDYSCILSGNTADTSCTVTAVLPSASDITYAATQSTDTSANSSSNPSLLTQMNQLTQKAQLCAVAHH